MISDTAGQISKSYETANILAQILINVTVLNSFQTEKDVFERVIKET